MTDARPPVRIIGWLLASAMAVGLIGFATAYALAAERRESVIVLDLGAQPPSAPEIAAIAEAAPEVAPSEPRLPQSIDPDEPTPILPEATPGPVIAAPDAPSLAELDRSIAADLTLPTKVLEPAAEPETRPKPRPERKSESKPKAEAKADKKQRKEPSEEPTAKAQVESAASAPSSGQKAKGGANSAAAYAKTVLKKVRATKKQSGAGKGRVVVGFSIAADGGLASVTVLQSSGTAELDQVALNHIRRSAPFPAPPSGARPSYSFEFVGK